MLNVHPSLLPRWRGAAPIERTILAGDAETGVTILRVTAGLDSGPLALREAFPLGDDDYGALEPRLAELSGELLVRALDLRAAGELTLVDQDEDEATYAEKIAPEDRRLDPALPATELERRVRALNPHIGTYLTLEGEERLGVRRARTVPGTLVPGTWCARTSGSCSAPPMGASTCSRSSRRARRRWRRATTCAATRRPAARFDHPGARRGLRGRAARLRGRRLGRPRAAGRDRAPRRLGARAGHGPAARLRRGAAARQLGLPDRRASPGASRRSSTTRSSPPCGWASTSCSSLMPRSTPPSTRRWSWRRRRRVAAAAPASSTRSCGGRRARGASSSTASPSPSPPPRRRVTPTRRGWPSSGGRSSGPRPRSR